MMPVDEGSQQLIAPATPRLAFRRITEADADFIFELYCSDAFKRLIGDKHFRSVEDARRFIATNLLTMYRSAGMGLMLVELRDQRTPIGICGLIKRESLDEVDLGFGFLPDYEGCGYGGEAARSFISFARQELRLSRIVAITTSNNVACIRLLGKLGFEYERVQQLLSEDVSLGLYGLSLE